MFNASQSTTSSAKDSNVSNDKPSNATPKDGVNVKKKDEKKKKKNRCQKCNKKLKLTDITCRCGGSYCPKDIPSDVHGCTYDYKKQGADEIRKNNPVVAGCKVRKI